MTDSHRRHYSAFELESENVEYRKTFARNSNERASTGTLKPPRLPGSEKFRFSQSSFSSCIRPTSQLRYGCDSSNGTNKTGLPQRHSKRRPILPISKNTSQVLNNTNAELSADTIDLIRTDTSRLTSLCQKYVSENNSENNNNEELQSDGWSCSSSEQSVEGGNSQNTSSNSKSLDVDSGDSFEEAASPQLKSKSKDEAAFPIIRCSTMRTNSVTSSPPNFNATSTEDIWVLRSD